MHFSISRRSFFKTAATAGLAFSGGGLAGNMAQAIEPSKRTGRPRFYLSLAAYSLRDFFNAKDPAKKIDLFKFIDFCAEHGCDGTELTSYYFPKDLTDDYLLGVRRHCFLRGIGISGTAVGNNFALAKGEKLESEIKAVKKWIDHAAVLGAPHIRVFAGNKAPEGLTESQARKLAIEPLEECCDYAGKKGVFLGLENHGGIVDGPDELLEIVKAVKSPWLGVNLDSGNFHNEDPYAALAQCAPYAVNVQIKVSIKAKDDEKKRPGDFERFFKILRDSNYQGYVALEYEEKEDPWTAIPGLLDKMKRMMQA
jgi:sugar phosphate isomerase/epimerase